MAKPKIVVTEFMWEEGLEYINANSELIYNKELFLNEEKLYKEALDADALIVRSQTKVSKALLEGCRRLKVIGRLGVGLNNIDLKTCREKGISVVYAKHLNAIAVAEHTVALMLMINKPIFKANLHVKGGGWDRINFTCTELFGKTLGVVGARDIGSRVLKRAKAFGMRLVAHDPYLTDMAYSISELEAELVDLPSLLKVSDYVSLHVPLTEETHHLIGKNEFELMKTSAYLINTSRGEVVDEEALVLALKNKEIAGAALDVREVEPPPIDHPLHSLDNVILTPHVAGASIESRIRVSKMVAQDVISVLTGNKPVMPVPPECYL